MFEVDDKTPMKHLFRNDGRVSPIVHLKPTESSDILKIRVGSEFGDDRGLEFLVHADDRMEDLRRAINGSLAFVQCDEPYVLECGDKIFFDKVEDESLRIGDVLSDGDVVHVKIRVHVVSDDDKKKELCVVFMNLADDRVKTLRDTIALRLKKKRISKLFIVRPDEGLDCLSSDDTMLSSICMEIQVEDEIYTYPAFFDGAYVCVSLEKEEEESKSTVAVDSTDVSGSSSSSSSSSSDSSASRRNISDTGSKKRSCCGCCGGTDQTNCTVS